MLLIENKITFLSPIDRRVNWGSERIKTLNATSCEKSAGNWTWVCSNPPWGFSPQVYISWRLLMGLVRETGVKWGRPEGADCKEILTLGDWKAAPQSGGHIGSTDTVPQTWYLSLGRGPGLLLLMLNFNGLWEGNVNSTMTLRTQDNVSACFSTSD